MDLPLTLLDREVARAASAAASARADLARGDRLDAPSPLDRMRRASSRATYLDLCESLDPLAAPLRPWIAALTLERVLHADRARLAAAWGAPSIPIAEPGITPFVASPRDLLGRILADPERGRRRIFADALARGAAPVADAARHLAERRAEAARLLGADLDTLFVPCDPAASLPSIAERLLVGTAPFVAPRERWDDALSFALARDAGEGWPARLNARWLHELLGRGPLTLGLSLDPGPLPAALGAASFARALYAFGAALADADGPRSAPFALSRAPSGLRRARRAALFATLAADPIFFARAFDLGRARARDQARLVARCLLVSIRLDAARVLCGDVLLAPERLRFPRFEERTAEALGAPIPPALVGVVPHLDPEDAARLVGALVALGDRRALVERFDEDWWRSPHAAQAIRAEDEEVPRSHAAPAAAIEAGLAELARVLHDLG